MTLAEVFKNEVLARLQAAPLTDYGAEYLELANIRRAHLTKVDRDRSPAIHAVFGDAVKSDNDKACRWDWALAWKVRIFTRGDDDTAQDPVVEEVVRRLDPRLTPVYSNGVDLRLLRIDFDIEVSDADTQMVEVVYAATFKTELWAIDMRATR